MRKKGALGAKQAYICAFATFISSGSKGAAGALRALEAAGPAENGLHIV